MFQKLPSMQDLSTWKDKLVEKKREIFSSSASDLLEKILDYFDNFTWKHWAALVGGIFCSVMLVFFLMFGNFGNVEIADDGSVVYIKVQPGMTARDIGEALQKRGVIANRNQFWLMAKVKGYESKFKAGSYEFHRNMQSQEVLDKLVDGATTKYKFVIPEGFSVLDIAKRLDKEGIINQKVFLEKAKNFAPYGYMEKKENANYRAEGFLFPATYVVSTDVTEEDLLKLMAETFDKRLTASMREDAKRKGLSVYELITLASLVEKEARYAEDRPIIAQVFFKRLKVGMPLQSDAPLQYLMDTPKEDVSIEDTKMDSPYNTYQHKGLPPGPIANPGMDSIEAVLHPANTDYLFFVADRDGHNHYSYTYEEHLNIVNQVR